MLDNGGHTGFSTIINELNASNIWENITITIGSQQFLFNVNEGNKTEIKTFRFGTPGPFNYTISSVALNKNNTTYRMNGAGTIDIDNSKNYTINVAVNNNQPQNLILDVVDVSAAKKGVTVQPNRNDKRFGGIPAADVHAFLRNGQKPVGLLLLDEVQNEKFYIYADGVIQVFNIPNKSLLVCGQKAAPYYKSWNGKVWIWSFTRNIGNNVRQIYVISNTNEVWAMATDGNLYKYGYVTGVDF